MKRLRARTQYGLCDPSGLEPGVNFSRTIPLLAAGYLLFAGLASAETNTSATAWPAITREQKPWTYWWWMGSAVDKTNITRELQRYHDAGLGGVHIIPIYGAKGWEDKYIPYLSPQWMEMLRHTVTEARRLDMGVDMTTGSGWCFGGPQIGANEGNASVVAKTYEIKEGGTLEGKFDKKAVQALVGFSEDGKSMELSDRIRDDGDIAW